MFTMTGRGCIAALLSAFVLSSLPLAAQSEKRPINHDDYDKWPSIQGATYSVDGKWMAYAVNPTWGDGVLYIKEVDGRREYSHPRGTGPTFSANNRYVVFSVRDSAVEERDKELEELWSEEGSAARPERQQTQPQRAGRRGGGARRGGRRGRGGRGARGGRGGGATGGGDDGSEREFIVLDVTNGSEETIKVRGASVLRDGDFLVYHLPLPKKDDEAEKKEEPAEETSGEQDTDSDTPAPGSRLVVRSLATGAEAYYEGVVSYRTVAEDAWLLLTCSSTDSTRVRDGLFAVNIEGGSKLSVLEGQASFTGFTTDSRGSQLAFTSDLADKVAAKSIESSENKDEDAPEPRNDIYVWDFSGRAARRVASADTQGVPGDGVIQSGGLSFSDDGSVLMFGIRSKPTPDLPKILDSDKVVLDIWHWNDGLIQPMQARQGNNTNPTLSCALHMDNERVVVLGTRGVPSVSLITRDGSRALATDSRPYEKLVTWDGRYSDVYLVNTLDGSRQRVKTQLRGSAQASPSGKYLLYFGPDSQWYSIDAQTMAERCLTSGLGVRWENELDDHPAPAGAYGIVGWTAGDGEVLINDRFDIWKINPTSGEAVCVTDGYGRANNITLRYSRFDLEGDDDELSPEERDYLPQNILLTARDEETKSRGYYTDSTVALAAPKRVVMMEKSIGGLTRAKSADRLFFTLSTFAQFPDIWVSDMDFGNPRKLTDACPIQSEVRWGDAELVEWANDDGVGMKGILIKPEGFDPKKKYPMMVFFYERNADSLYNYRRPAPGTSPNATYYVSNGYLWFIPDIIYTVGYPGESAEKCIISGVQSLIARGYVDEKAIGTAGHSWGGYQTAHLVTRSNIFAAAESGAPVSNMFSAYGGIRYQTGMSRQFQYEKTQSRIGGTPWEYPQRYWQNSPVFYADRVETPVLILHNDQDGAVPWTNGIEFFMALRRMGKEAYLFNYVGEPHGIRKRQNSKDWARRMAEFFDHHLKGAPAPRWMTEGVPYAEREREKIQFAPSYREALIKGKLKPDILQTMSSNGRKGDKSSKKR